MIVGVVSTVKVIYNTTNMTERKNTEELDEKLTGIKGRFLVALILSGIIATLFLWLAVISIQEQKLDMTIFATVLAGLHIAAIILAMKKKKIGRTIGIIAWIPFCTGLVGIWGIYQYIYNKRIKNTLTQ